LSVQVSDGPEATEAVGARVAASLKPGDVVLVRGELGSGKTTFVRGACRALGVEGPVTSPTFTIGHRYDVRVPVAHLDLYRRSTTT
jgi:tRNA threonylcarbamoyladenosine biosynthesis protein TsaE